MALAGGILALDFFTADLLCSSAGIRVRGLLQVPPRTAPSPRPRTTGRLPDGPPTWLISGSCGTPLGGVIHEYRLVASYRTHSPAPSVTAGRRERHADGHCPGQGRPSGSTSRRRARSGPACLDSGARLVLTLPDCAAQRRHRAAALYDGGGRGDALILPVPAKLTV